ncbi:hypothetical protein FACS189419_05450 [Planctomycetales bacterium]|nr:hypothetical protein FACS189419_05450 [Planctomycetales bacterium]
MKWNRLSALCIGVLFILSSVGCMCTPGYRPCGIGGIGCAGPGVYDYYNNGNYCSDCRQSSCVTGCDETAACNPCEEVDSYSPCSAHGAVNCGSCLGNLGTGVVLVGRGVLNVAAAPFLLVGNLLSKDYGCAERFNGNCCGEAYYGDNCYQPHDFNDPCNGSVQGGFSGRGGCANCNRQINHGENGTVIQDGTVIEDVPVNSLPNGNTQGFVKPKPTSRVVQAGYLQPKTKFVKPQITR